AGNTHRVTLALDSQIAEHATSALSPVENDILNGTRFALAWRDNEVESFLDQTWIDGWLREAFTQYADGVENRSERDLQQAMRGFEYQA
ncbi:virulence factor SrfB, partial [Enterobacter hormaechei]